MILVYYQIVGLILFFLSSLVGRFLLERYGYHPVIIRVVQVTFHLFQQLSAFLYVITRIARGSEILNLGVIFKEPLLLFLFAVFFFILSFILVLSAQKSIVFEGKGGPTLIFTRHLVTKSIYKYIRNPMALGWYFLLLSFAFYFNSLYFLVLTLLGYIPSHLFYLKVFEEKELRLRFGKDYVKYKEGVPFIIPKVLRQKGARNGCN